MSDWIEANIKLPEGVSALPGTVRLWPYQREIADAISDPANRRAMIAPNHKVNLANAVPLDGRGHRSPQTLLMLDERDAMLREAAAMFFPGDSMNATAKQLHRALDRYCCGAWLRERVAITLPSRHLGRLDGFCWRLLRTVNRVPGESRIRQIISRGVFAGNLTRFDAASRTQHDEGSDHGGHTKFRRKAMRACKPVREAQGAQVCVNGYYAQ